MKLTYRDHESDLKVMLIMLHAKWNNEYPLQWRHNESENVSNHQLLYWLINCWLRRRWKKPSKLHVTGLCAGIHRWPVNFPHKMPVTRKMFPFDDIIMQFNYGYKFSRTTDTHTHIFDRSRLLWLVFIPDQAYVHVNVWNNTLRPRQVGRQIPDDTSTFILLDENICVVLKISRKFVPKVRINNIQVLVQIVAWRRPGDKPFSEPMMANLLTHICVTRPQSDNVYL